MQNPKHRSDKQKHNRLHPNWDGLGNEPRNENLAKIRGPGSFERKEYDKEKEQGLLSRNNRHKRSYPRR